MVERSKRVRCHCKTYCTIYNPITRRYEGQGQLVSRSTRDNHVQDDRILAIPLTTPAQHPHQAPVGLDAWVENSHQEMDWLMSLQLTSPNRPLKFRNNPGNNGVFTWPSDREMTFFNYGLHSLTTDPSNQKFLMVEHRLCELYNLVSTRGGPDPNERVTALIDRILTELGNLTRVKELEWGRQRGNNTGHRYFNTELFFRVRNSQSSPTSVGTLVSLVLSNLFFLPRRGARVLLGGMRSILRSAGVPQGLIPLDPRTGARQFDLDPVTHQFVACPSCHSLYPLDSDQLVLNCTHRRAPESPVCNTALWKSRQITGERTVLTPRRKHLHQDLKAWVGRLLSRKNMEDLLDNPVNIPPPDNAENSVEDIWRSTVFRNLKDRDGQPFFPAPRREGRLVFSLSVDSFNPFYNKTAKQSVSSTGIWLVLLNLPPHLRYLQENMYLASVISGPDKPSKEDLYPYLQLVVKDLLEFWHDGVMFSRTYRERLGRLFRAMLVPVVCDMLAARQVVGLGSATSHNFCTFCDLDIDDIDVLDRREWPTKDPAHIRRIGELWRNAPNETRREDLFEAYGIRWSPLHDLPYWQPVQYTVIDSMHAIDLNILQNHCRSLFQIDINSPGGHGYAPPASTESTNRRLSREAARAHRRCIEQIRANNATLFDEIIAHPRQVLYKICVDNNIRAPNQTLIVGVRWILASNIVRWRQSLDYVNVQDASANDEEAPDEPVTETPGPGQEELDSQDLRALYRVVNHLLNFEDDEARTKAYRSGTQATFRNLATRLNVAHDDIVSSSRRAKKSIFDRVMDFLDDDPSALDTLESILPDSSTQESRAVLGKELMEAIWSDMARTRLPTWITAPPPNWGTTQRGKLSADHWRVICTIHLPITLIRMWHNSGQRQQAMLSHFMTLVTAVRIANLRRISSVHIELYNALMQRYLRDLRLLYPDQHLKPTHHAALHIGDMLGLFGPSHSHSSPHYERYINFFHHVNTNSKIGELEGTFLRASARQANLRSRLSEENDLQQSVRELIQIIDKIAAEDARGAKLAEFLDPRSPTFTIRSKSKDGSLSDPYFVLLCTILNNGIPPRTRAAIFLQEVSYLGVSYGVYGASTFRNSYVLFRIPGDSMQVHRAGIIEAIFQYSYQQTLGGTVTRDIFLAIRELTPADASTDPYREYGVFGGFLCHGLTSNSELRMIPIAMLISHFAATLMHEFQGQTGNLLHVMPVDRLMLDESIDDFMVDTSDDEDDIYQ